MSKGIQKKIEDLRQQPENVRIRAAAIFSAIGGGALLLVWMFILLPLEVHTKSGQVAQSTPNPTVAGTTTPDDSLPADTPLATTIDPALYAATPTPVVTQVFTDLPSSSPADNPSPSGYVTPTDTPETSSSPLSLPVATAQPN